MLVTEFSKVWKRTFNVFVIGFFRLSSYTMKMTNLRKWNLYHSGRTSHENLSPFINGQVLKFDLFNRIVEAVAWLPRLDCCSRRMHQAISTGYRWLYCQDNLEACLWRPSTYQLVRKRISSSQGWNKCCESRANKTPAVASILTHWKCRWYSSNQAGNKKDDI